MTSAHRSSEKSGVMVKEPVNFAGSTAPMTSALTAQIACIYQPKLHGTQLFTLWKNGMAENSFWQPKDKG